MTDQLTTQPWNSETSGPARAETAPRPDTEHAPESEWSMGRRTTGRQVIARVSPLVIGLTAAFALPSTFAFIRTPNALTLLWVVFHVLIGKRVAQIGLEVSREGVEVINFTGRTLVPIWEAEAEVIENLGPNPVLSDSGGKYDNQARALVIRRRWNGDPDVNVGVVPRYGNEIVRIHQELVDAIAEQRAAW